MAFNVNDIRSQMSLGGARPALFQVIITNPVNPSGDLKTPFMVTSSQLPGSTIGTTEVPYFGRITKFAGDRTFEPWTVQILNDEDFLIRNALEQWSNSINDHVGNVTAFGSASPILYKSQAQVTQFSKTGVPIREYTFEGIWPQAVEPIDVSWESQNEIQRFGVTFEYDYWTVSGGITGNAGTR